MKSLEDLAKEELVYGQTEVNKLQKNSKEKTITEKDTRKEFYVQKYSTNRPLSEAVIVNGLPFFLQIIDEKPVLLEKIELPDMILKPLDRVAYLSKEYSFKSIDEINLYIQKSSQETFDSLYAKLKEIWKKYIDARRDHIIICAADTLFTYFQDKLGMTHYLLFVGDNDTGKSNNLVIFQYLGYRPMFDTTITGPNIFQFLGSVEEGQGIILEDELDNLDQDIYKKKIYQVGYKSGTKVSRITETAYGRSQQSYWTFGFKAFSSERAPDNMKAKGFNERVLVITCSTGNPQYDISEIINPAGDTKYSELLDELQEMKRILLVYRLLHHANPIPDIQLNVKNRDKQLTKPLIRLFQDSNAVHEITATLSKLLSEKRQRKINTLEARLYSIILDLVEEKGPKLENKDVWISVLTNIEGSEIPNKPQSYDTEEFYVISKKKITKILVDRFGAVEKSDGKSRYLVFNIETLMKLGINYSPIEDIKIISSYPYTSDRFYASTADKGQLGHNHSEMPGNYESQKKQKNVLDIRDCFDESGLESTEHPQHLSDVSEVSDKPCNNKIELLKCPQCKFKNIYRETIEHHIKYKHGGNDSSN
jgi:hypothetical protein